MAVTHYQNGQGNNDSVINILINIIITDIHTIICGVIHDKTVHIKRPMFINMNCRF
jgi:hypothetical protein